MARFAQRLPVVAVPKLTTHRDWCDVIDHRRRPPAAIAGWVLGNEPHARPAPCCRPITFVLWCVTSAIVQWAWCWRLSSGYRGHGYCLRVLYDVLTLYRSSPVRVYMRILSRSICALNFACNCDPTGAATTFANRLRLCLISCLVPWSHLFCSSISSRSGCSGPAESLELLQPHCLCFVVLPHLVQFFPFPLPSSSALLVYPLCSSWTFLIQSSAEFPLSSLVVDVAGDALGPLVILFIPGGIMPPADKMSDMSVPDHMPFAAGVTFHGSLVVCIQCPNVFRLPFIDFLFELWYCQCLWFGCLLRGCFASCHR